MPRLNLPSAEMFSAIASSIAAIMALLAFRDSHEQLLLVRNETQLDQSVALVRYCQDGTRDQVHDGDDLLVLYDTPPKDDDYEDAIPRKEILDSFSHKTDVFLQCDFINESRVPLLHVKFYYGFKFHHRELASYPYSVPFVAIPPGGKRVVWVINEGNIPVEFDLPDRIQYARFPDIGTLITENLQPVLHDRWALKRDSEPYVTWDQKY